MQVNSTANLAIVEGQVEAVPWTNIMIRTVSLVTSIVFHSYFFSAFYSVV